MKKGYYYHTKIGIITIAEEDGYIVNIEFKKKDIFYMEETPLIKKTFEEIQEYFDGKRDKFDIPIKYKGTFFQMSVWQALLSIPYGKTKSYGEIARELGNSKAYRAVGMACNANPLPILIPCHRVIGKNGQLIGFGGGLNIKEVLLNIESGVNEDV